MIASGAEPSTTIRLVVVHPLIVRITHWINAVAMLVMITSGWTIYNVSPLLPFTFPRWAALGGWLGGALAWHFAAMWVLAVNGLIYIGYGLVGRHFMRSFLPLTPRLIWRDLREALTLKLRHELGVYNAVQRLIYCGVLALIVLIVLTGLSIWKPVQFEPLTRLFGDYEVARRLHFAAMAGILGFVVLHVAMVALVPATFVSMITGRAKVEAAQDELSDDA